VTWEASPVSLDFYTIFFTQKKKKGIHVVGTSTTSACIVTNITIIPHAFIKWGWGASVLQLQTAIFKSKPFFSLLEKMYTLTFPLVMMNSICFSPAFVTECFISMNWLKGVESKPFSSKNNY